MASPCVFSNAGPLDVLSLWAGYDMSSDLILINDGLHAFNGRRMLVSQQYRAKLLD